MERHDLSGRHHGYGALNGRSLVISANPARRPAAGAHTTAAHDATCAVIHAYWSTGRLVALETIIDFGRYLPRYGRPIVAP
jgi:hypothetical protein